MSEITGTSADTATTPAPGVLSYGFREMPDDAPIPVPSYTGMAEFSYRGPHGGAIVHPMGSVYGLDRRTKRILHDGIEVTEVARVERPACGTVGGLKRAIDAALAEYEASQGIVRVADLPFGLGPV